MKPLPLTKEQIENAISDVRIPYKNKDNQTIYETRNEEMHQQATAAIDLAAENQRLREALEEYGWHKDSCALIGAPLRLAKNCTCGFNKAL